MNWRGLEPLDEIHLPQDFPAGAIEAVQQTGKADRYQLVADDRRRRLRRPRAPAECLLLFQMA
ncbi:MAG: hypothetical protein AAF961_18945, partial [Planctomycetota bacterium]